MSRAFSVLVIGAGAAGLAAGQALHEAGCDALILEARERIGGRIHTDYQFADVPVELGAEFIHGERAVTHKLVRQAGLSVIPVERLGNLWWAEAGRKAVARAQLHPSLQRQIEKLLADYHRLPEANMSQDISLADYLRSCGWDHLAMAAVLLAQTCCANLDSLSCYDLMREMNADHTGYEEARIQEGYGALLSWYSRDLAILLKTPVDEIHWSTDGVTALAGATSFEARACIITVPVSILQREIIRFEPPLSENKRWAIQALRMRAATKLIYRFQERLWPEDLTYMAHPGATPRWWTPGYQRANGAILCAYMTTEMAENLDMVSEASALASGLRELSALLDIPLKTLERALVQGKRFSWATEYYTLGGYAHAPPAAAAARPLLAQPEGGVMFFAGEATAYDTNPQTVHGAIESGWRAARECLVSIS